MATDSMSFAGPFLSTSATDLLTPAPALHACLPDKQGASRPAAGLVLREMNGQDLENGFLETLADLAEVELTLEQAREVLRQRLRRDMRTYVACQDGRVVGTASLLVEQKFIHGGGRCGHIEDVVVERTWQGRGVAQALVRYAVQESRRLGCYKVILNCFEALVPFYTRCGFRTHDTGMRLNLPVTPSSSESR